MAEPLLVTSADPVAEAAHRLASALLAADRRAGFARIAIARGSAARALGLARREVGSAAWSRVRLTWVDERCVPFADPESNRGEAWRAGDLSADDRPGIELPLYEDGETPAQACERVERALQTHFGAGLDAVLLGMGPDGHIASLFPGRPTLAAGGLVLAVHDSPKPPPRRVTLTLPLLASTPEAILLCTGEPKRAAIDRVLRRDPALPASALPRLVVVTDLSFPGGDT